MKDSHNNDTRSTWPLDPATYRRVVTDPELGHGEVHLWHFLRVSADGETGIARIGVRKIAEGIGCHLDSIKAWTENLRKCGYLRVRKVGRHHHHEYEILSGNRVPESRDTKNRQANINRPSASVPESRNTTPRRVPESGDETVPETRDRSKGSSPKPRSSRDAFADKTQLAALDDLIAETEGGLSHDCFGPIKSAANAPALARLRELRTERRAVQARLAGIRP